MNESTKSQGSELDGTSSINEILLCHPAAVAAINAHGIDACCGGAESLAAACAGVGVDVETVLSEIRAAANAPRSEGSSRGAGR